MAVILCENKIIYYNRHLQLFFSMNKSLNTAKDRKILPLLYIKCDKNPLLDPRDEVGTGGATCNRHETLRQVVFDRNHQLIKNISCKHFMFSQKFVSLLSCKTDFVFSLKNWNRIAEMTED